MTSDLVRITHGLWRPADAVDDLFGRCCAVLSAMPPNSVIGGLTAARLHGLWLPEMADGRIEVLLHNDGRKPRERAGSVRADLRTRRRQLASDEIVLLDGLPVTSETRTWIDLAEVLAMPDLVAAGDSVLRGRQAAGLDALMRAATGRRGIRRARAARELLSERSRSRPESHLRYAMVAGGLPMPEVNRAIYSEDGVWLAEPDLHYKRARLALEYNGADHANLGRMRKDITRNATVLGGKWLSIPFGPIEVFGRPDQAASLVRHYLDERDPSWRHRPRVATYAPSGGIYLATRDISRHSA